MGLSSLYGFGNPFILGTKGKLNPPMQETRMLKFSSTISSFIVPFCLLPTDKASGASGPNRVPFFNRIRYVEVLSSHLALMKEVLNWQCSYRPLSLASFCQSVRPRVSGQVVPKLTPLTSKNLGLRRMCLGPVRVEMGAQGIPVSRNTMRARTSAIRTIAQDLLDLLASASLDSVQRRR